MVYVFWFLYFLVVGASFGYCTAQTYRYERINGWWLFASVIVPSAITLQCPLDLSGLKVDAAVLTSQSALFIGVLAAIIGVRGEWLLLNHPQVLTSIVVAESYRTTSRSYPTQSLAAHLRRAAYERFPVLFKDAARVQ
ncbi:hypothetical protein EPO33_04475 [Patescibacteria group bacterium]|nr:MAG: hypothetical protein EPO33_04475 [Patescibacteria group bacterium]